MPAVHHERIAAIVVDTDERPVSAEAFDALVVSADSSRRAEVVVVDARTTPGRAWTGHRGVRVVGADASVGPTRLRLRGVATTDAPVLAFLDGRAVPEPDWLDAASAALAAGAAAVSGAVAGVGEPTLAFTGNVGAPHPLDGRRAHDVLYPVPEAMVVGRATVAAAGGFHADLGWPLAVVDLGWRLSLAGHRVVLDPSVRARGTCGCTADALGGIEVLHACLGDGALAAVLPAALLVAARRDPGVVDGFVASGPALAARRAAVQATRARPDDELLRLVVAPLDAARGDESLEDAYADAAARHDLDRVFTPRRRILVVTPDIFTAKMAGPAIRAWQIADALAGRHLVRLASTASRCDVGSDRFEVSAPDDRGLRDLADWAEIVVVQGFAMEGRAYLGAEDKIVLVDLYDPLHLEQLELFRDAEDHVRRVTVRAATRVLNEQLVRGDFFVCASPKQRDFWLGQFAATGRVNHIVYDDDERLESLLAIAPFGLPDAPPVATAPALKGVVPGIGADDEVVLWGGGIYNWLDPLTLIRAVDRLRRRRPAVRLFFMGLRHPNPDVTEMRVATEARRLAKELRLTGEFVFFNEGWVPYEDRQNFLLEADVGVSTHLDHVETAFSFRTRILDYLWAALPIVATGGDWFGELIEREGLGLVVPAGDVDALEDALFRMLTDRAFAASCRAALARVRPGFTWGRALEPVVAFCDAPRRAPDLCDPELRRNLWAPGAGAAPAPEVSVTAALRLLRQRLRTAT